jgi:predicted secreted protein with PEFG-CTERM motif
MKYDGTYMIKAQYVDVETTVSIELTNAIEATGTVVTGTVVTGTVVTGTTSESFYKLGAGQIEYDITCNATPAFFGNADDDSIIIYLDPIDDGIITVTLHEELIKPFEDGTFVVIVNNQEIQDYTQVGNTLTIPCVVGTEKIEIHGSWAIPEFGVIAAMILAVAIVSIIVVTAKTKLSIVPRY